MGYYESIFILQPDLGEEEIDRRVRAAEQIVTSGMGQLTDSERWGKKRLAYEVKKNRYGYYVLLRYHAEAPVVRELERHFKITESVLKYMTVRVRPGVTTPAELRMEQVRERAEFEEGEGGGTRRLGAGPEKGPHEGLARDVERFEPNRPLERDSEAESSP